MREPEFLMQVWRGLLRQGFGRRYAARAAAELEEHRLDLVEEGLRQGLVQSEAESRANAEVGDANCLVREFTVRLRQSTWLGRHPIAGFAAIGILGTLLWWAVLLLMAGTACGLVTWGQPKPATLSLDRFSTCADWIRSGSYVLVPWMICLIGRRYHCGWKAALWGCAIVGVHNALNFFVVSGPVGSGSMSWGYTFNFGNGLAWLPMLSPIAVFAIDFAWNIRSGLPGREGTPLESLHSSP